MAGRWDDFRQRKLERLRLGQAACEIVDQFDDPQMRFALVPLSEADYTNSLYEADKVLTASDGAAGAALRDEIQRQWVIFYASRSIAKLDEFFFDDVTDVGELAAHEINYVYDVYLEMVAQSSPAIMGLSEGDFSSLKVLLPRIEWSELSGTQWYAAQRFLNSIQGLLLTVRSSGFSSTESLMTMSEPSTSAENAHEENLEEIAPDAAKS